MSGTKAGAQKAKATNLKKNPKHYSDLGKRGEKGGAKSSGSFTKETGAAAGKKGGRLGKRQPLKQINKKPGKVIHTTLDDFKLHYEDIK